MRELDRLGWRRPSEINHSPKSDFMGFVVLSKFPPRVYNKTTAPDKKVCKTCPDKGEQPLENFSKQSGTLDGRSAKCKKCTQAEYKQKQEERRMIGL